jgi:hypothetical protein
LGCGAYAVEFKVALNGIADVFQCLGHRCALGMATWQFGATDRNALRMFEQRDVEFAFHLAGRLRSGVGLVNAEQAQVVFACRRSFQFPIAPDFILHS